MSSHECGDLTCDTCYGPQKIAMKCRHAGCTNYAMVDLIPPTHWSWTCPECEAHEFERDTVRGVCAVELGATEAGQ